MKAERRAGCPDACRRVHLPVAGRAADEVAELRWRLVLVHAAQHGLQPVLFAGNAQVLSESLQPRGDQEIFEVDAGLLRAFHHAPLQGAVATAGASIESSRACAASGLATVTRLEDHSVHDS